MRSRMPLAIVCIAGLALVAPQAFGADAAHITPTHRSHPAPVPVPPSAGACYSQLDADNGLNILSQWFEPDMSVYNARAADDFTLHKACSVRSVDAVGVYYNGSGPAIRVQVIFYRDNDGTPGDTITTRRVLEAQLTDQQGNLHIPFDHPVDLAPGISWVSVRVRMDLSTGEWGWLTNNTLRGNPAVWRNPGDGFGTGCLTYGNAAECLGAPEGPDLAFALHDTR